MVSASVLELWWRSLGRMTRLSVKMYGPNHSDRAVGEGSTPKTPLGPKVVVVGVSLIGLGFTSFGVQNVWDQWPEQLTIWQAVVFSTGFVFPQVMLLLSLLPSFARFRQPIWLLGAILILAQSTVLIFGTGLLFPLLASRGGWREGAAMRNGLVSQRG